MENEEPIEEEAYFETTSQSELIACAFYAISAVVDIDTALMDREQRGMVERIMKRSLRIIDSCINDLYEAEFEEYE